MRFLCNFELKKQFCEDFRELFQARNQVFFHMAYLPELRRLGTQIKEAVESVVTVAHPTEPSLGGVYGTVITGPPDRQDSICPDSSSSNLSAKKAPLPWDIDAKETNSCSCSCFYSCSKLWGNPLAGLEQKRKQD